MTYSTLYTDDYTDDTLQTRIQRLYKENDGFTHDLVDVDEQRKLDVELNNPPIYEDDYCTVHRLNPTTLKDSSRFVFLRLKGCTESLPIEKGYPTKMRYKVGYNRTRREVTRWGVCVPKVKNSGNVSPQGGGLIFVTTRSGKSWVSWTEKCFGTVYTNRYTVPFKKKSIELWEDETDDWVEMIKENGQPSIESLRKVHSE